MVPPTSDSPRDLVADAARAQRAQAAGLDLLARQIAAPAIQPATEQQALLTARVARDLAARLAARFPMAGEVEPGGVAGDPRLVAAALARVDEHRLDAALRARRDERPAGLVAAGDAEGAALELALLRAESRRVDARGDPVLAFDDLPAELIHALTWRVAARLRRRLPDSVATDDALAAAATGILGTHDEGQGAAAAAHRLARHLARRTDDPDALLVDAVAAARPAVAAALVAERGRVDQAAALAAFLHPDRLALLLRAVGVARDAAIRILLLLAEPLMLDDDWLVGLADGFDALDPRVAADATRLLRLDPAFRAAILEEGA